jgi:hypothetical protein
MIGSSRLMVKLISNMIEEGLISRGEKRRHLIPLQPKPITSTVSSDGFNLSSSARVIRSRLSARATMTARGLIRKRSLPDRYRQTADVAFATPKGVLHDAEMDLTQDFAGTLTQYLQKRGRTCMS